MKRALVLAGGGSRGAFEVGAIDYLVNQSGLDFHLFCGTSVGSLNAAVLGCAHNYRQLKEQTEKLKSLWLSITGNKCIYNHQYFGIFNLLFNSAFYNPVGLRKLIKRYIDPERLCNNPFKYIKAATVAIETGELFFADTRNHDLCKHIHEYILASASIPLFFPPVFTGGKHWYDGGLRDVTPLGAAFKEQPDEIIIILTFPVDENLKPVIHEVRYGGVFKSLLRTINIMSNEISANDLQLARTINLYHRLFPGKRRIPIYYIAPKTPLKGDTLDFNPQFIRENIKKGYETAHDPLLIDFIKTKPIESSILFPKT